MALLNLPRRLKCSPTALFILSKTFSDKVLTLELENNVDVMDVFTSKLVQKKSNKWETFKIKKRENSYNLIKPRTLDVNIKQLSALELDQLYMDAIDERNETNIDYLITECCEKAIAPNFSILVSILEIASRNGNIKLIENIKHLMCITDNQTYINNCKFDHYLAEANWIQGNVIKAIDMFENAYRDNIYVRRRIRLMLKCLILDITNRSEAVLVSLIKFGERIHYEFKDYFPLACVWQACFVSEWFTDQTLALELLDKHDGLCKAVVNNIPFVVSVSLRTHQTDVVYRLLEILLKYEMKLQYSIVLVALFEYRFRQGDLRSCSEIMQWSVKHEVILPTSLHERFLLLLLGPNKVGVTPKAKNLPKYDFKF